MAETGFQVLVVGAGPTGLTVANILGLYGIRTLLVERTAATVAEPRAVSIDDESLRTMQFLGLIDTVRPSIVEGYGSHYFSPNGRCFTKVVPDIVEYGYLRRSAFRQPVLEAQLREGLGRFSTIQTRFSTAVTMLEESDGEVRATLLGADGTEETIVAEYVAACDGARSATRQALGIRMVGSTYDKRWLIIDLVGSTQRLRHTQVYCDPARPGRAAREGPDVPAADGRTARWINGAVGLDPGPRHGTDRARRRLTRPDPTRHFRAGRLCDRTGHTAGPSFPC